MDNLEEAGPTGRTVDIELGSGQEVITIDLEDLDPNPKDVLDLLNEGHPGVWVWTKLAAEYWRKGYLEAAELIATTAIQGVPLVLRAKGNSLILCSRDGRWISRYPCAHICAACQHPGG